MRPPPRRLDPCPCGSGRRYRDCHGALGAEGPPPDARVAQAVQMRLRGEAAAAREACEAVLAAHPDHVGALNLRGLLLQDALDVAGALASFERAIALAPGVADAHFNRSLALLLLGRYAEGWAEYEWRTRLPGYADYAHHDFGMPRWRGEPLAGRRLLVHAEQGHGDTIQFARFLAPLAARGVAIDLFCHPPLRPLLARVAGVATAMASLDERPTHDFHAPIADVAAHFLPDTAAAHWWGPYLAASPGRRARFEPALAMHARPRIGLAWKGSPRHLNDRNRSLDAAMAARLVAPGATFVSLQQGAAPLAGTVSVLPEEADWDDTAAVIASLDRVVTVDTAIAHLAGAMGKPVHVLLPYNPDWRWGLAGEATRWYPSMRLFRQARPGEWGPVIERVVQAYGDA
ncbi:MAG TPA: SEC-C metal-binding domain-containing protein [Usitatibacter sp.]|nr:SEC-C metal-binding domain-containing protein [Usitatibacter sp.]